MALRAVDEIKFYGLKAKFGEFSNFYPAPITINGKTWPTTEHYFQGQKFPGTAHEEEIRLAKTPAAAKKKGGERHRGLRSDWEQVREDNQIVSHATKVKDDIMYDACLEKFRAHPKLQEVLLSTGDAKIIEHTTRDKYWGDGGNGSGRNQLGVTLMRVRGVLARQAPASPR